MADQSAPDSTATNPPAAPMPLTFNANDQSAAQGFYRVVVDP